jgi:hypothetical protein
MFPNSKHRCSSPDYPNHLPDVPCPLPRRIERLRVTIASLPIQPSSRPLSRGSSLPTHPDESLDCYQINRQFSGWIPPPQVIRPFGAHRHHRTNESLADSSSVSSLIPHTVRKGRCHCRDRHAALRPGSRRPSSRRGSHLRTRRAFRLNFPYFVTRQATFPSPSLRGFTPPLTRSAHECNTRPPNC